MSTTEPGQPETTTPPIETDVEFPPEAEEPAEEPAESLEDDGTPGAAPPPEGE